MLPSNFRKLTSNNSGPHRDIDNINVYSKFNETLSIRYKDIGLNRNSDSNQGP